MTSKFSMPYRNSHVKETNLTCMEHQKPMYELYGSMMCIDCAKQVTDAAKEKADKDLMNTIVINHFNSGMIPKRLINKGFKDYLIKHEGMRDARSNILIYGESVVGNGTSNMIMVGACGTGKTHLAVALIKMVLKSGKYARYTTSADMAEEIAAAWSKPDDNEFNTVHRFADYQLLVIDEYGLHDRYENRLELVHKVLLKRYDLNKPTVIISNMLLDDVRRDLGDRIWSRLNQEGLQTLVFDWADWRMGN